ncbi:MAG: carbohydrate porin [Planctomycetaceae bacterium]|jgi:porin|nr:carbohydrate porin [Planctomycetaceae bacterium]
MSVRNSINFKPLLAFLILLGLTMPLFGQGASGITGQYPARAAAGQRMILPMEQSYNAPPHTEGMLGECFPHLHGTEALHFDYTYTGGVFNNARGGMKTKNAAVYNGIFDLGITADTEKLGLWRNGTFYVHSFFSHGNSPSRYIQDYQGASAFAYETPAQVSEYWYEHRFYNDALTIKSGKQDAGADFFYLESTADFLNSSATCVPTTYIPTAPDNAWGVSGFLKLTEQLCFKAGIFDAQADANTFWMSEEGKVYSAYQLEYHTLLRRYFPGFIYAGMWYDDSDVDSMAKLGETVKGNHGFNFGFEQMLYRRHICRKDDLRGITMFFQYADSQRDRNELKGFWNLGFHWLGMFDARPEDALGFALNTAQFSAGYRAEEGLRYSQETAYEIFYKVQLTENVMIQPDLQYIVHPGGQHRDSLMPGLVFQVVF